jgi:hypothetical protein
MEQYATEYMEAVRHTEELGVELSTIKIMVRKNCVDLAMLGPALNEFTEKCTLQEMVLGSLEFTVKLGRHLTEKLGIPFTLTAGWFEDGPRKVYQHDDEYLKQLINRGFTVGEFTRGIDLHFWLTSPAFEILDLFLMGMIAMAAKLPANLPEARSVIYYANNEPDKEVRFIYHPTIVGEEFLEKIGASIRVP